MGVGGTTDDEVVAASTQRLGQRWLRDRMGPACTFPMRPVTRESTWRKKRDDTLESIREQSRPDILAQHLSTNTVRGVCRQPR